MRGLASAEAPGAPSFRVPGALFLRAARFGFRWPRATADSCPPSSRRSGATRQSGPRPECARAAGTPRAPWQYFGTVHRERSPDNWARRRNRRRGWRTAHDPHAHPRRGARDTDSPDTTRLSETGWRSGHPRPTADGSGRPRREPCPLLPSVQKGRPRMSHQQWAGATQGPPCPRSWSRPSSGRRQ